MRLNWVLIAAAAAAVVLAVATVPFTVSSESVPEAQPPAAPQPRTPGPFHSPAPGTGSVASSCPGDDGGPKRIQALYVRDDHQPALSAKQRAAFKQDLKKVDAAFVRGAKQNGGGVRRPRYTLDGSCRPTVTEVVIPRGALTSVDNITAAIKQLGYNRDDRKYIVWYELPGCGVGFGVGGSDRPDWFNLYNFGPHYAAIGTDCWGWAPTLHELLHTLGAVQASAPHGTKNGHCWDDEDVMCYDDQSLPAGGLRVICTKRKGDDIAGNQIDCNGDDYFNTNPPPGSYLATHWNVADNDFLIR